MQYCISCWAWKESKLTEEKRERCVEPPLLSLLCSWREILLNLNKPWRKNRFGTFHSRRRSTWVQHPQYNTILSGSLHPDCSLMNPAEAVLVFICLLFVVWQYVRDLQVFIIQKLFHFDPRLKTWSWSSWCNSFLLTRQNRTKRTLVLTGTFLILLETRSTVGVLFSITVPTVPIMFSHTDFVRQA